MVGEPLTFHHARSTRRRVVVVAGERNTLWRCVVGLPESRFCLEVDRGTAHLMVGSPAHLMVGSPAHLMVGSPARVEVVVGKFAGCGKVL